LLWILSVVDLKASVQRDTKQSELIAGGLRGVRGHQPREPDSNLESKDITNSTTKRLYTQENMGNDIKDFGSFKVPQCKHCMIGAKESSLNMKG